MPRLYSLDTSKSQDSIGVSATCASRRSSRKIKKPSLFKITHERRPDPELQAALKRSKLETSNQAIDYSSITLVPIVYATKDEFSNPIKLWNKYSTLGEQYGAIKVVPPEGYSYKMPVNLEKFEFKVRKQRIQLLSNGNGFSYPSQLWNCEMMRRYDKQLKMEIMGTETPTLESVESEYWDMVRKGDPRVISYYGADLNVFKGEENDKHCLSAKIDDDDPWNLCNLPRCEGSLLKYINSVVPGVNSPWLYIGMIFTSFCWHTEDNYFGSVNYHHSGAPKVWYLVPPKKASKMESILKNYSSLNGEEFALYGLRVQIPPDTLVSNDVTIYRMVQQVNEFVLVWPRTFHCGFNAGFNCNEACNIAPGNWIKIGYQSLLNYKYARKTCIPFFRILMSSIPNLMDLDSTHIKSVMECMSLLIIEEYELRCKNNFPQYQMFLDMDILDSLPDITSFLSGVDKRDFDYDLFVNALYRCDTSNHYQFLVACKDMAEFCIKDCDLCDSPTFGSSVLCNHINTIVCINCLHYHECSCKTRVVLYRYPLHMFYTILTILKKVYCSMTGEDWEPKVEFKTPSEEDILRVDSASYFAFRDFHELFKNSGQPEDDSSNSPPSPDYIEVDFEEFSEVCRKLKRARTLNRRKNRGALEHLVINQRINVRNTDSLSRKKLIYVTKLTVKYIILALEEDKNEGLT
ncbi:hypothetical protein MACK_000110 [Theileria orientalis]|uniref:Uncharacterized protein n=1 Tax=Theileria orientalis TaxID=68886 RepID=A0A976MBJ0_THEOR|nr:hypothetical protein MACK_000110 [Theileria orientalis]